MNKSHILLTAATLAAFTTSAFAGITSFTDDFNTASSGDYTEGGVLGGNNGWTAATTGVPFTTTDIAGTGLVEIAGATDDFINMTRNVGSFDVGESITVSTLFSIGNGVASTFNNALAWNIGLSDAATGGVDLGLGVGGDSTDWYIRGYNSGSFDLTGDDAGALMGLGRDTDQHTISMTLTKTATADTFTAVWLFDSTTLLSSTITNSAIYGATNVFLYGLAGGGGVNAVGGIDVDNISVVPEPGTFALLAGFAALSFVAVRRRK